MCSIDFLRLTHYFPEWPKFPPAVGPIPAQEFTQSIKSGVGEEHDAEKRQTDKHTVWKCENTQTNRGEKGGKTNIRGSHILRSPHLPKETNTGTRKLDKEMRKCNTVIIVNCRKRVKCGGFSIPFWGITPDQLRLNSWDQRWILQIRPDYFSLPGLPSFSRFQQTCRNLWVFVTPPQG